MVLPCWCYLVVKLKSQEPSTFLWWKKSLKSSWSWSKVPMRDKPPTIDKYSNSILSLSILFSSWPCNLTSWLILESKLLTSLHIFSFSFSFQILWWALCSSPSTCDLFYISIPGWFENKNMNIFSTKMRLALLNASCSFPNELY